MLPTSFKFFRMKSSIIKSIVFVFITFLPFVLLSQVKVAADADLATPADPSAVLDVFSNTKGMLPPRLTTSERDAVAAPADGLTIYNTDESCINVYHNSSWQIYCKLRYNTVCGCVEYLNDYGLPTEAWISISTPADHDWYEVGTTAEPDAITDDIYTEGKATIGGQINTEGRLNVYGDNVLANAATYMELTGANGTTQQQTLSLYLNSPSVQDLAGIRNVIDGTSSTQVYGMYQEINQSGGLQKYGVFNDFTATSNGTTYGFTNQFASSSTSIKYGLWNNFTSVTGGTNYGVRNDFDAQSTSAKYGMYNDFSTSAAGTKYGLRTYVPSSTLSGTVYGVYNSIYNDGPSSKYGMYNLLSGIDDGTTYGVYNRITMNTANTDNAYGTYNYVTNSGSGTGYGGYFRMDGAGDYGIFARNTTNGGRAGAFQGDVEIGDGWLVVGDALPYSNGTEYNTVKRYGVWEGHYVTNVSFDFDGYQYFNIGNIDLPTGLPATVTGTRVVWEVDGYHTDANEDHGVWIALEGTTYTGTAGWYGWFGNAGNGAKDVNWRYVSNPITKNFGNNQNLRMRVQDEDCTFCGGDDMRVFNISVKIFYEYTVGLNEGDIAAAGLIYSNSDQQVGDLAEHFEVNDEHPIEYGLLVGFKPGTDNEYEVCSTPYSNHMVGVISEKPSVVLNNPSVGPPVALQGRVKVKLVDSDVLIKSGDHLTSSKVAGHAKKATKLGKIIGYAVTNQKPGTDFVEILIQPGLHLPDEDADNHTQENQNKEYGRRMD